LEVIEGGGEQTDGTSWWGRGAIDGGTDALAAFIRS